MWPAANLKWLQNTHLSNVIFEVKRSGEKLNTPRKGIRRKLTESVICISWGAGSYFPYVLSLETARFVSNVWLWSRFSLFRSIMPFLDKETTNSSCVYFELNDSIKSGEKSKSVNINEFLLPPLESEHLRFLHGTLWYFFALRKNKEGKCGL